MQSPEDTLNELAGRAVQLVSPCGEGHMVWHCWGDLHNDRPVLILLHGGYGSWTHWVRAIPLLSPQLTIVAADLPGLGASSDAPQPHTADGLAAIVSHGLTHVLPAGKPFHLAGFSFGGMLGSIVATRHPRRCLSFTAIGASGFGDLHYIVDGIRLPDATMSDLEISRLHRDNLNLLMFADPASADPLAVHIHRTNVSRARVRSRRLSMSNALLDALPDVQARLGGIWGGRDVTGGGLEKIRARASLFRGVQPQAQFDVIDGAGHWVMYETADAFCTTLLAQLALL